MRTAPKIALATLCLAIVASEAQAVTIRNLTTGQLLFKDTFENAPNGVSSAAAPDNTGDYNPVAEIGTWQITGDFAGNQPEPNPNLVQVASGVGLPDPLSGAFQGDNYLRTTRDTSGAIRAFAFFDEQSTPGDVIRFEAALAISAFQAGDGAGITAWDNTGAPLISMGFNDQGNTSNTDGTFGGSSVNTTYPELDFTPGEWFRFAIDWTIGEDTFDMTVGNTTVTGLGLRYNATDTTPTNIAAFALGPNTGRPLYADYVPEPSSIVLLGLALAGVYGCSRRRKTTDVN